MNPQISGQKYVNIETFRKNGVSVKTPIWFVQDGETLLVRTGDGSGKVKRIHNNPKVNIAPCKADGALLGDWVPASAREINDAETNRKVDGLLDKKYGLMKKTFDLMSIFQRRKYTVLEVKLES